MVDNSKDTARALFFIFSLTEDQFKIKIKFSDGSEIIDPQIYPSFEAADNALKNLFKIKR